MTDSGWVGSGLFLLGWAVFITGVYIKLGPEMAMILGGGSIAYVGAYLVRGE